MDTLPPDTFSVPVPLLPTVRFPLPEFICNSPDDAVVVMSNTTVFEELRFSVPVFVSESVPVPEIVLVIVSLVPD